MKRNAASKVATPFWQKPDGVAELYVLRLVGTRGILFARETAAGPLDSRFVEIPTLISSDIW